MKFYNKNNNQTLLLYRIYIKNLNFYIFTIFSTTNLILYDPQGIDLRLSQRIQYDGLKLPEVGLVDEDVLRTHVVRVRYAVQVEIVFALVADTVVYLNN